MEFSGQTPGRKGRDCAEQTAWLTARKALTFDRPTCRNRKLRKEFTYEKPQGVFGHLCLSAVSGLPGLTSTLLIGIKARHCISGIPATFADRGGVVINQIKKSKVKRTLQDEANQVLSAAEKFLNDALPAIASETRRDRLRRAVVRAINAAYTGLDLGSMFAEDDTPTKPHGWNASPYSSNKELWLHLWGKDERAALYDGEHYYQAAKSYGTKNPSKKYVNWMDAALNWAGRDHAKGVARYKPGTTPVRTSAAKGLENLGL